MPQLAASYIGQVLAANSGADVDLSGSRGADRAMDDPLERYQKHIDHCFELAERAPDDQMRARFLRIARLFEIEARLLVSSMSNLAESQELLARSAAALSQQAAAVQAPLTVRPYRATGEQAHDT